MRIALGFSGIGPIPCGSDLSGREQQIPHRQSSRTCKNRDQQVLDCEGGGGDQASYTNIYSSQEPLGMVFGESWQDSIKAQHPQLGAFVLQSSLVVNRS